MGAPPPGIWQISKPYSNQGDRLCPPQYYEPPRIFRPCDGPDILCLLSREAINLRTISKLMDAKSFE